MPQEFDDILIKVRFSFPIDSDAMNVSNQTHGAKQLDDSTDPYFRIIRRDEMPSSERSVAT